MHNAVMRMVRRQRLGPAAWGLWLLALALAVAAAVLVFVNRGVPVPGVSPSGLLDGLYLLLLMAPATVGAVIASRRPANLLGWLFLAFSLGELVAGFGLQYARYVLFTSPGAGAGGPVAAWVGNWQALISLGTLAFVLLLYPDGRVPSPRWRPVAQASVAVVLAGAVGVALSPGPMQAPGTPRLDNPFGVESLAGVLVPAVDLLVALVVGVLLASLAGLLVRFRRARGDERQQLKWLLFPAAVAVVALALASAFHLAFDAAFDSLNWLVWVGIAGATGVPVGAGLGVLKYRLLDIDLVIRRTLVYGVLWVAITLAYLAGTAAFGLGAVGWLPVEAVVVVTIAATLVFEPIRRRLDRLAARWVFGTRPTDYELLSEFSQALDESADPADLGPQIADSVRSALDVRWVRVLLQLGDASSRRLEVVGTSARDLADANRPEMSVPLVHAGEEVGVIECGPKSEGRPTERDFALLATLARQATLGIRNARLAADLAAHLDEIRRQAEELEASRTRILHAQDTERRRLERDIHDGVQQELVSLMTKLQLARNQLRRDPRLTDATLGELQAEAHRTLDDVRELARGIHPRVLTDRGLIAAIESRTAGLPIGVRVEADPALRDTRFAADVEAAAYFFCSEAMANTLKHANAATVVIRIAEPDGQLVVEVEDDGIGIDATADTNGLTALRDRLESVGGQLRVSSRSGQGTHLLARLPTAPHEPSDA